MGVVLAHEPQPRPPLRFPIPPFMVVKKKPGLRMHLSNRELRVKSTQPRGSGEERAGEEWFAVVVGNLVNGNAAPVAVTHDSDWIDEDGDDLLLELEQC